MPFSLARVLYYKRTTGGTGDLEFVTEHLWSALELVNSLLSRTLMPFAHSRPETVVASREYFHLRGALVRVLSTGHSTVSTRTSGGSIYIEPRVSVFFRGRRDSVLSNGRALRARAWLRGTTRVRYYGTVVIESGHKGHHEWRADHEWGAKYLFEIVLPKKKHYAKLFYGRSLIFMGLISCGKPRFNCTKFYLCLILIKN